MGSRYFRAARVAAVFLGVTAAAFAQIGVFGGVQGGMNATRSGTGAPSNALGSNGDLYIDTTNGAQKLYGPKANGTWPPAIPFAQSATACGAASSSALGCLIVPPNSGLSVDASGHVSVTAGAFLGDPGANGILMRTAAGATAVATGSNLPGGYLYGNLSGAPTDLAQFTNNQMGYLASGTATAASSLLSLSNGTLMEDRSDPAMSTFNIGFHNWLSKVTNVVLIGDSWTEGAGYTSYKNVWAEQLRNYLQSNSASHGSGIVPLHTSSGAWTLTGTWNTLNNVGPYQNGTSAFNMLYQASGAANTAAMTVKYYGDHLVVYYATYTDTAAGFSVATDGGTPATFGAATSATFTPASVSIPVAAGWHTAVITAPATGNCYLYGAEWLVGTAGLSVHNLGRGGARSEAYGSNTATQMAWLKQIGGGVQLAVIALGLNDAGVSVPLATYQTNLQAILTYLKANFSPVPSILILDQGNASPTFSGSYPQSAYTAIEQQLAIANGAMFLSVSRRWGAYANASALGVMYTDGLHPNDTGHLDVAQLIERRVVENTIPYVQTYPSLSQFMGNPTHNIGNETSSTGFGQNALGTGNFSSTGFNTAVGQSACSNLTTGHNNTCVGQYAGGTGPTTGLSNTLIGSNAQAGGATSYAVQLGGGTNNVNNTAQYQAWNFLDNNGYGDFKAVKLSAGTVSTSATSTVPVFGITHLQGSISISTLVPPSTSVGQGNAGQSSGFTGCVKLIADSGTTMATGGNIFAAYTLVAGKMYNACFDGQWWYLMGSGI